MSEETRKPFDLEAARNGAPIVCRDGKPVKFVAYVEDAAPHHQAVVLRDDVIGVRFGDGCVHLGHESFGDLFMANPL